jgi:signal transduction histidine kinase
VPACPSRWSCGDDDRLERARVPRRRRLRRLDGICDPARRDIAAGTLATPLRIEGADPEGDEIDRLATHVERLSERIARQLADLERAAQRRGELLANVSHDLRTPLASMQGYLELLLLRQPGPCRGAQLSGNGGAPQRAAQPTRR